MRSSILIVDDSPMIIHLVSSILEDYHLRFAMNGGEALEVLRKNRDIDLILLDVEMPVMTGYEFIKIIKQDEALSSIPVIFLTVKNESEEEALGLELGAVDYIKKPINTAILKTRVDTHINLRLANIFMERQNDILEGKVKQRTREILITRDVTIQSMMSLLEVRDIESGQHIKRTQLYMQKLCTYLSHNGPYQSVMTKERMTNIYRTAPLHDIGKIGIPDKILLKPAKLTVDEFSVMKQHADYAIQAFSNVDERLGDTNFLNVAKEIAGSHHEKWDGTGYPFGLKGEDIPLAGRMMAIADVYDALVSKRVYKEAFSHTKAKEIILEGKGTHFDPFIVEAFLAIEEDFKAIKMEYGGVAD